MKKNFVEIRDLDEEDEDNDNSSIQKDDLKKFESKAGGLIYLIDARKKMFLPSFDETELPVARCLQSVRLALRKRIFRLEKCFCSIVLLGTKKTENALTLSNLTVIQEFELLGAHHILKIDGLIKAIEDSTYEAEYGYDKFSLGDAFWLSSHIFSQKSQDLNKTVILFTNDDNSTCDDSKDESRAIASAQDMFRSHTTFDIIPLGNNFDFNIFYKKIVQASKNDANCAMPDPITNVSEIVERLTRTNFNHVNLVKLPFIISEDFQIGVSVHFLVRKAKIPFKTKLSKATNEKVTTKTEYFNEETGAVVTGDEIVKSQIVALMDINFRPSELKLIQDKGKKELRLLGFKPASVLRLENFVKPCAFIYPDDSEYKGSSVFFTALLKRCIAKQVVPICTFCPRTSSSCRFVALLAQNEIAEGEQNQNLPPGFVVFFLPFAEEVRTVELKATRRATPEQVDLAMKFIKKLKFPFKPGQFENPRLTYHWAAIEALALDLNEPEEVEDTTFPNYDLMSQRSGQIAKDFMDAVYEEDYHPESFFQESSSKKLKSVGNKQASAAVKKADVEDYVLKGKGETLPNEVLKVYLKSVGVTKGLSKTKKAGLIEMVRDHLNTK